MGDAMDGRFDIVAATNVSYAKSLLLSNEGSTIDLTSWANPAMKIRDQPGGTQRLSLTPTATANGSSIAVATPATFGMINLLITPADLQALPVGFPSIFSYDFIMTDPSGIVRRLMWGSFIAFQGVTV